MGSGQKSGFIKESARPTGVFGIFEDDGETSYLYIYEPEGNGVICHLHIYSRNTDASVREDDVQVQWSADGTKCDVRIFGEMRGFINISSSVEGIDG